MNGAQALMLATMFMIILSLGCLILMRSRDNFSLTARGIAWSVFFGIGASIGIYLLLTGDL